MFQPKGKATQIIGILKNLTHHFGRTTMLERKMEEDQLNKCHANNLQPLPNQTRVAFQDNEDNQQQSDDDSVSFAYISHFQIKLE